MDFDYGVIIGLIATMSAAGMLGLSYVGAYLLGRAHGRRATERAFNTLDRDGHGHRLQAVESAVDSVGRAVGRLAETQRLLLLDQQRPAERPAPGGAEQRLTFPRAPRTNTPA